MGPTKQVVQRPQPSNQEDERRTKARHEASALDALAQPLFPAASQMGMKTVAKRCYMDFAFIDLQHFRIGRWLRDAGLVSFCSLTERFYLGLIREFFGSLA